MNNQSIPIGGIVPMGRRPTRRRPMGATPTQLPPVGGRPRVPAQLPVMDGLRDAVLTGSYPTPAQPPAPVAGGATRPVQGSYGTGLDAQRANLINQRANMMNIRRVPGGGV